MAAAGGDEDEFDGVVVKNPDELPLHQKVRHLSQVFKPELVLSFIYKRCDSKTQETSIKRFVFSSRC